MNLGWIGLGIMGSRQAANLRRAGHELTVYNRTRSTAEAWVAEHGGHVAATPREVAERSEIVFSMVVDGAQVEQVLLDQPDGAVHGATEGALFVDMTTIAPSETVAIGERLAAAGVSMLDAPVTGSSPKAQDGTLTIMCGGAEADYERALPAFEAMGKVILHVGSLGHGEMIKLISNAVAATNAATVAQALVVGRGTGVDLDKLVEVLANGAAASTMLDLKARPMLAHDFTTLFKLEHMLKDVRLCLDEGQRAGVPFPAAAAARELYTAALGRGLGEQDFAAVLTVVEAMAGTEVSDN